MAYLHYEQVSPIFCSFEPYHLVSPKDSVFTAKSYSFESSKMAYIDITKYGGTYGRFYLPTPPAFDSKARTIERGLECFLPRVEDAWVIHVREYRTEQKKKDSKPNSLRYLFTDGDNAHYQRYLLHPETPLIGETKEEKAHDSNLRIRAKKHYTVI